jgi:hypothetical protein
MTMHINEYFRGLETIPHSIPGLRVSVNRLTRRRIEDPSVRVFLTVGAVIVNCPIDWMFGSSTTTYPTTAGFLNPLIPRIFMSKLHYIIS